MASVEQRHPTAWSHSEASVINPVNPKTVSENCSDRQHVTTADCRLCQTPLLHPRDGRTDEETRLFGRPSVRPSVRSFVRLFVRCICQGRPSYGGTNRDAS